MPAQQVWLITGTSSGFGEALVQTLLERGEKVIATARTPSKIEHLAKLGAATLQLDVTASPAELDKIAEKAVEIYGKVDVLVNNAGYFHFGTLEEATPQDWQAQFGTNVFGAINTTRAFLPHFRSNKSGTIIFVGSAAALSGLRLLSLYCSSKAALTSAAESLAQEVSAFGVRTLIVQPGFFRTDFLSEGNPTYMDTKIGEYKSIAGGAYSQMRSMDGQQPGDPKKGADRIIDVVKGEGPAKGKEFPLTLMLGEDVWGMAKKYAEDRLKLIGEWKEASFGLNFD